MRKELEGGVYAVVAYTMAEGRPNQGWITLCCMHVAV